MSANRVDALTEIAFRASTPLHERAAAKNALEAMGARRKVGFWSVRLRGGGWTVAEVWDAGEGQRVSMLSASESFPLGLVNADRFGQWLGDKTGIGGQP